MADLVRRKGVTGAPSRDHLRKELRELMGREPTEKEIDNFISDLADPIGELTPGSAIDLLDPLGRRFDSPTSPQEINEEDALFLNPAESTPNPPAALPQQGTDAFFTPEQPSFSSYSPSFTNIFAIMFALLLAGIFYKMRSRRCTEDGDDGFFKESPAGLGEGLL